MSQVYYHLATVNFLHSYFKDGLFKSLTFTFSKDSVKLLNDLGVVFKQFYGGFHLLSASPELLISENNKKSLKFYLNCSDPYYINYTQLSAYSQNENILYFNNLNTHKVSEENTVSLQKTEFVDKDDLLHLSYDTINILDYNPENNYTFYDVLNNEISIEYIMEASPNSGKYIFNNLPEGTFHIKSNNELTQSLYNTSNPIWKKPMGVLELFTDILYQDYITNEKANYIVNFNNRSSYWKYFLVSPIYKNLGILNIINGNKDHIFEFPEKQLLDNNTEAIVLTSKSELPLLEYTNDNFQLVAENGNIVLKNLPRASPEQLYNENTQDGKIIYYSHIYI